MIWQHCLPHNGIHRQKLIKNAWGATQENPNKAVPTRHYVLELLLSYDMVLSSNCKGDGKKKENTLLVEEHSLNFHEKVTAPQWPFHFTFCRKIPTVINRCQPIKRHHRTYCSIALSMEGHHSTMTLPLQTKALDWQNNLVRWLCLHAYGRLTSLGPRIARVVEQLGQISRGSTVPDAQIEA